jgi:hypothetical protein
MSMRGLLVAGLLVIGLLAACTGSADVSASRDLGARLMAANLLAGSLAAGLAQASAAGVIAPESDSASALHATLAAVEMALDSAGDAWRAGLPTLAESNLGAAEQQMAGLRPFVPRPPVSPAIGGP